MNSDRKTTSTSQENDETKKRKIDEIEATAFECDDEYDSDDEEIPEEFKIFMQFLVKHCLNNSLSGDTLKNNSFALILNTQQQCEHFIRILNDFCSLPKVIKNEDADLYHYYNEKSLPPQIHIGNISLQKLMNAIHCNRDELGVTFSATQLGNEGHKIVNLQEVLEEIFPREQNINIHRAIPQLEDHFVTLSAQVNELTEQNAQLAAQVKGLSDQNIHLTAQVRDVTEQNIQLAAQVIEVKEHFSAQVNILTTEKTDMEARLKKLEDLLLKRQNECSEPSNSSNSPNTDASIFSRQRS